MSKAGGIPRKRQQKRQGPGFKGEPGFVEKRSQSISRWKVDGVSITEEKLKATDL